MKEFEIRDQIIDFLEQKGILCWKDKQVVSKPRKGTFHKSKGTPDIMGILKDGRFLGIEVKTKTGKLTDSQIEFMKRISNTKAIFILARDVDDVIACLVKEKLL